MNPYEYECLNWMLDAETVSVLLRLLVFFSWCRFWILCYGKAHLNFDIIFGQFGNAQFSTICWLILTLGSGLYYTCSRSLRQCSILHISIWIWQELFVIYLFFFCLYCSHTYITDIRQVFVVVSLKIRNIPYVVCCFCLYSKKS